MRKIIIAATTIATLAVPAVSMAANSAVVKSPPKAASYVDPVTHAQTDCTVIRVVRTGLNGYVIDREHCKLTTSITNAKGKTVTRPDAVFAPFKSLSEANFGNGWASDYDGQMSTSLVGHANADGTGFSIVATYPVS
jgi:hypothetical protein